MKLKSFLFALGFVFVNTCTYAQSKNILPALEAAFSRKAARIIRTSSRMPYPTNTPLKKFAVPTYRLPRQHFTVLGNIANGTFIMNPLTDTQRVTSARPRFRDEWRDWTKNLGAKILNRFDNPQSVLFRGISIENLAELENLLRNGSQIEKTHFTKIYFSSDPSDALYYMTEQVRFSNNIPVLITVKSSLSWDDFFEDIPAEKQEVFAYLYYNGKYDWYHVSLTEQGQIMTKFLSVYLKEQKVAEQDTNNKTGIAQP